MSKKVVAAILKSQRLHMKEEVLAEAAKKYQAHTRNCEGNNAGVVKDEDHPLRGWYDYKCPRCGRKVRVVFNPSSGGGITRFWGLDLPTGPVTVRVSPNSTQADGVQYDVLDLGGSWLAKFHPAVWALYELTPVGWRITDWIERIGNPFKAIVVEKPMRTLIIYPSALLPPKGWKAEGKYYCKKGLDIIGFPFNGDGDAYAVPYPGGNFLLLTRPQIITAVPTPEIVKEAAAKGVEYTGATFSPPINTTGRLQWGRIIVRATRSGWLIEVYGKPPEEMGYTPISIPNGWGLMVPVLQYKEEEISKALKVATEVALRLIEKK